MSSVHDGFGAALQNHAVEILRIGEALGPVTLVVNNQDSHELVVSVNRLSDGALVLSDDDTAVSGENTGYTGTGVLLVFSAQLLNNFPILPGSVLVQPTAGGNSVDATDRDGDGNLYTSDNDEDPCGTVNYFTGALELSYPTGKAPAAGAISADYAFQGETVKGLGLRSMKIGNLPPSETLIVSAAADGGNSRVRIEGFISF